LTKYWRYVFTMLPEVFYCRFTKKICCLSIQSRLKTFYWIILPLNSISWVFI